MPGNRYKRGSHTVTDLKYHFVWKTKYSYKVLQGDIGLRVRELVRETCASKGMSVVSGNVRPNHVHVLIKAPAYLSPAKMAQYMKGRSSHQLQQEFPKLRKRYWGQHLWG